MAIRNRINRLLARQGSKTIALVTDDCEQLEASSDIGMRMLCASFRGDSLEDSDDADVARLASHLRRGLREARPERDGTLVSLSRVIAESRERVKEEA